MDLPTSVFAPLNSSMDVRVAAMECPYSPQPWRSLEESRGQYGSVSTVSRRRVGMKRSRLEWLWPVATACCAGLLGYLLATAPEVPHAKAEKAEPQTVAGRVGDGDRGLSNDEILSHRISGLERQLTELKAEQTSEASKPEGAAEQRAPTLEQRDAAKARWRSHMADVHERFLTQERDSGWARQTTAQLRDTIAEDPALSGALREVECRSTICRVQLLDDRSAGFAEHLPLYINGLGETLPVAEIDYVDNADGTRSTSVYLHSSADAEAGVTFEERDG